MKTITFHSFSLAIHGQLRGRTPKSPSRRFLSCAEAVQSNCLHPF